MWWDDKIWINIRPNLCTPPIIITFKGSSEHLQLTFMKIPGTLLKEGRLSTQHKSKINCNRYNSSHSHRTPNCCHVMHTTWNLNKQIVSWKWIVSVDFNDGETTIFVKYWKAYDYHAPTCFEALPTWRGLYRLMSPHIRKWGLATCLTEITSESYPNQLLLDVAHHVRCGWDATRYDEKNHPQYLVDIFSRFRFILKNK